MFGSLMEPFNYEHGPGNCHIGR